MITSLDEKGEWGKKENNSIINRREDWSEVSKGSQFPNSARKLMIAQNIFCKQFHESFFPHLIRGKSLGDFLISSIGMLMLWENCHEKLYKSSRRGFSWSSKSSLEKVKALSKVKISLKSSKVSRELLKLHETFIRDLLKTSVLRRTWKSSLLSPNYD